MVETVEIVEIVVQKHVNVNTVLKVVQVQFRGIASTVRNNIHFFRIK